jgi:hypothetical protein
MEFGFRYTERNVVQQGINAPLPVSDYLVWSIVSVLFGGILGVIALVFSILCRNDLNAGRYDSARQNSNVAFWCNVICLGLLMISVVCLFLFFVCLVLLAM